MAQQKSEGSFFAREIDTKQKNDILDDGKNLAQAQKLDGDVAITGAKGCPK